MMRKEWYWTAQTGWKSTAYHRHGLSASNVLMVVLHGGCAMVAGAGAGAGGVRSGVAGDGIDDGKGSHGSRLQYRELALMLEHVVSQFEVIGEARMPTTLFTNGEGTPVVHL